MDPNRPPRSSSSMSPLGWLGCGCGTLVALVILAIVSLTWFGYRKGKEIERTFKDPESRTAATREVLPWRELPAGYHAAGAISIPLFMDMAILSDEEPPPGEMDQDRTFEETGLIYMRFNPWISDQSELQAWLEGKVKETPGWIERSDAQFDPERVLRRGTVEAGGRTVPFLVARGEAPDDRPEPPEPPAPPQPPQPQESPQDPAEPAPEAPAAPQPPAAEEAAPEDSRESLTVLFTFDCPGDDRARLGVWFAPDPAPGRPDAEVDLTGTIGDPQKIREFVGHFEPCK